MAILHKMIRSVRGPRHHLEAGEKEWVEHRLLWLKGAFGPELLRQPPLEPTSSLLPRQWDGSEEAGRDLLCRLCKFMRVDAARVQLDYYSKEDAHKVDSDCAGHTRSSGPAGLYFHPREDGTVVIALEKGGLAKPSALAATICHELGHVHLLADGRIKGDEKDCEPLTDLLTVYFGVGIFTANSAFQFDQWQSHSHQGWSAKAQGYLPERIWGYALAGYAWMRGEANP